MYTRHPDFPTPVSVTTEQLQAICDQPVLKRELFDNPVIIKSFELIHNRNLFMLRVKTACGASGTGIPSDRAAYLMPILQKLILPYFIGKDARDLDSLIDGVYVHGSNYKLAGLALFCCISWVEAAILDLLGRMTGKNAGELLGDIQRTELDIYVASGNRGTTPEEEVDILQRRLDDTGAKACKFKLGGRMSRNADSIEGRTEGLLQTARRRLGDGMVLHTDGNGSYDAAYGIKIGKLCEDINAYFYEEPCPFDDLWDTKTVADALTVPIAFGEQETSLRRFMWIIENDAATVIQPDLQYAGGFIRCTKVARMAAAAGKIITPHVSGGFSAVYMLLYIGYTPNAGKYHEYKNFGDCYDIFEPQLVPKDGKLQIPQGAGLGMTIDENVYKRGYKIFTVC
jgi:L-alanine-DL-glutamate epimerase-like enolase superfamily enzyme